MKKLLPLCFLFGVMINVWAQDMILAEKTKPNKTSVSLAINGETTNEPTMDEMKQKLILADRKTRELFKVVEDRGLIVPGKFESELNAEIVKLAKEEFGMENHWHKKIVRSGVNTLQPYSGNSVESDDSRLLLDGDSDYMAQPAYRRG